MQEHYCLLLQATCFGYLLESLHQGDSNKYSKCKIYKEIKLRILYNSKFILLATCLGTNTVIVTRVHCLLLYTVCCWLLYTVDCYILYTVDCYILVYCWLLYTVYCWLLYTVYCWLLYTVDCYILNTVDCYILVYCWLLYTCILLTAIYLYTVDCYILYTVDCYILYTVDCYMLYTVDCYILYTVDCYILVYCWLLYTLGHVEQNLPLNMHKMCRFRSSCTCAKYHPGLCSPFMQSVVSC